MDKRRFNGGNKNAGRKKGIGLTFTIQRHCFNFIQELLKDELFKEKAIEQLVLFNKDESDKEYFIYVMESGGKVKIGFTSDISKRISNYKTHTPDLKILCVANHKDADVLENLYHIKYNDKRINGEWFDLEQNEINELLNDINLKCYGRKKK